MIWRALTRHRHAVPLLILGLAAGLLFMTTPTGGDFWWYDSSRHAMNGVFVRDFLLGGGLLQPKDFALAYYQRYPAINIGFYPPMFYITSAPFLMVFGVSHAVSQAVVALHAALAGWFVYLLCAPRVGRWSATCTALILLFLPGMALWSRQLQIDVPAVAWQLAFTYCLVRHVRDGQVLFMFAAAAALGCAVLTRVQSVYAFPVFVACLLVWRYANRPRLGLRLWALVVAALLALPAGALLIMFRHETATLAAATPGMPGLATPANWLWYARQLPGQLSLPVLVAVAAGLTLLGWRWQALRPAPDVVLLAALLASSWLLFTLVSNKDPRFNLPSLAPLLILAAIGLHHANRRWAGVLLGVLAMFLVLRVGLFTAVPAVGGFAQAARAAVAATPSGGNILVSAQRDGSFIYDVRALNDRRQIGTRRADKLFVKMSIMRELGIEDRGLDEAQLLALLARENIKTIVAQPEYLDDQPTMALFKKFLAGGQYFAVHARVPMTGNRDPKEHELVIYTLRP